MSALDDDTLQEYHQALRSLINGNADGYKASFSRRDDVSIGNPFGPFARGRAAVELRLERAAANYRDGEIAGFDEVARYETPELACLVEVERFSAKVGGGDKRAQVAIRVTSVFRPENGVWKVVHRHADPITTDQPADSVVADGPTRDG